jgi:hypothetical protein
MTFPWLEDSARILGAATPDALWRHLCENVHLRAMPNTFEAVCAFQRLHRDRPAHALRTAQLICTDLRWRRVTAPLIVDIEQSGILDERALDQLAGGFLWEDTLGWPVPEQWLRDGTVRVGRKRHKPGRTAVVIDRMIPPPLRRWATARVVRREPRRAADVLVRIDGMDAGAGDATMAGLLDAAVSLPLEARVELTELGCAWPNGTVRLRALKLLAETDREAALQGAAADASATVRAWGQKLASPPRRPGRPAKDGTAAARHAPTGQAPASQASLFN